MVGAPRGLEFSGSGAGTGLAVALHSIGTPDCLHAFGSEIAKLRLMGTWRGTPPVTMRHKQSWPLLMRSLSELQQAEVGDDEFEPVARNPMQEPKLRIIGPVQMALVFVFEFDWPEFSMISALFILLGAAAQSDDCTNVVITMSPCLNYGNSSAAPSAACCTQLGTVARSQPQCLCQVIDGGASTLGLNVDQSQALALPKACNVQTDATKCKGSGSKTGQSSNGSSDAISISLSVFVIFFLFLQLPMF